MIDIDKDIVVGFHSIEEAFKNSERENSLLVTTAQSLQDFIQKTKLDPRKLDVDIKILGIHEVQEEAKKLYGEFGHTYQRVTSNMFLVTNCLPLRDFNWLQTRLEKGPCRLLCLDQVTDAHNGAAILRTASFYGVDAVIVSMKGSFGVGPHFHRIASGASEHVPIVKTSGLPKTIGKLQKLGVLCVGLSEHASEQQLKPHLGQSLCLVLGAEDIGLSNAVSRVVENTIALKSHGQIKSLNVSVAAALAMEKFFSLETA